MNNYLESVILNLEEWSKDYTAEYIRKPYKVGDYVLLTISQLPDGQIIDFDLIATLFKQGDKIENCILFGLAKITEGETAEGILIKDGVISPGEIPTFNLIREKAEYNFPAWVNPASQNAYIDIEHMLSTVILSKNLLAYCHINLFDISKLLGKEYDMHKFYERLVNIRKKILNPH